MTDLTGKTIAITGASSGLGRHFAGLLAAKGAKLALMARRTDRLEAEVDTLLEQPPNIDTIVLACTHFPLLKDELQNL